MYEPTTHWDRAPTDAELNQFWGKDKSTAAHDEIIEKLTKTVLTVPAKSLSLDYVKTVHDKELDVYRTVIAQYPATEVLEDYLGYEEPLQALIAVFEKSTCPLVAEFRMKLAERFAYLNADELEEARS